MPPKAYITSALKASKEYRHAVEELTWLRKRRRISSTDMYDLMEDLNNGFFPDFIMYPGAGLNGNHKRQAALYTLKWRNPRQYKWIMDRRKYRDANLTLIGALSRYRETNPKIYHQILDRVQKANPKKYRWLLNGIMMMDIKARYEWLKNK